MLPDVCPDRRAPLVDCRATTTSAYDGEPSAMSEETYDARGDRVLSEVEIDGRVMATAMSYDADGRLVEVVTTFLDRPYVHYEVAYRDDHRMASLHYLAVGGQPADWWDTWSYDADGRLVGFASDVDGDGVPEEHCAIAVRANVGYDTEHWTCDDRVVEYDRHPGTWLELAVRQDADLDGVFDYTSASTYDSDCRRIATVTAYDLADAYGDGHEVTRTGWTYDEAGRDIGQTTTRTDLDGVLPDSVWTYETTYTCP